MKLQSIQALRGFAALLVVFYHIRALENLRIEENGLTELPWLGGIFTNGFAGVDLFFVISGFIMVYVTHDAGKGLRTSAAFLFARVTRIYPVWWLFAGVMATYMIVMHGLSGHGQGWAAISRSEPLVPYLVKSFLLVPQPQFPILGTGWTLVHEMYFYAVFALFLLLPRKLLPYLLGVWGALVVGGTFLGYSAAYAGTYRDLVFYPMTMEFILGAFAGLAVTKGLLWRNGLLTLIATLWLLAALCLQGAETTFTLQWGRVLWFGLPCSLLIYGVAGLDVQRRLSWLVPALGGMLVTLVLYQIAGVHEDSPNGVRLTATIISVGAGAGTMAIIMGAGLLAGMQAPHMLRGMMPFFSGLLSGASKLGDWSYSLYLCHMIVLSPLRRIFDFAARYDALAPFFRTGHPGLLDNLTFVVVGATLSIAVAWMTYRFMERPSIILFGRMRKTLFDRAPSVPQAGTARG